MAQTLSHLCTSTRAEAMLDHRTRMRSLHRDRWIDYPRATEALQRLERLLSAPERERMPCMALHGDSNIGKTLIVSKLRREHPSTFDELKGVERRQIVAMQMPATPDQHRFYAALLFELGAPHSATASLTTLERLARDLLRRIAPRMLIVDEVHHLLAGGHREQRASLNLLKYLANELKICIVAVGTSDAPVAFRSDAQISSRFTPFEMSPWPRCEDFLRFLGAFEQPLPLRRPSNPTQPPIVKFIEAASAGLLGEVSRILNTAAEMAILDGSERITMDLLEHAAHAHA